MAFLLLRTKIQHLCTKVFPSEKRGDVKWMYDNGRNSLLGGALRKQKGVWVDEEDLSDLCLSDGLYGEEDVLILSTTLEYDKCGSGDYFGGAVMKWWSHPKHIFKERILY